MHCIKFPKESLSGLKKALNKVSSLSSDKRNKLAENGFNLLLESQKRIDDQILNFKNNIDHHN